MMRHLAIVLRHFRHEARQQVQLVLTEKIFLIYQEIFRVPLSDLKRFVTKFNGIPQFVFLQVDTDLIFQK